MKIAITGKGGVGKSTVAGLLALQMAENGGRVLAVDADPDANLASVLGFSDEDQEKIIPIAAHRQLIEEKTGAKVRDYGQIFKLNPDVSDVAAKHAISKDGVSLLVLGAAGKGGGGCACPENVLLKSLVTELVLYQEDALILDMEAGIEHLGRATAKGVDAMIVVVEPGKRSIDTALRIRQMCAQIGVESICAVANKITSEDDERFIETALDGIPLIARMPFSHRLRLADRESQSVLSCAEEAVRENVTQILLALTAADKSIFDGSKFRMRRET